MYIHPFLADRLRLSVWHPIAVTALRLFLLVLLIVVIVLIVRAVTGRAGGSRPETTTVTPAERVLDERFARGEIDAEEYERRRHLLQDSYRQ